MPAPGPRVDPRRLAFHVLTVVAVVVCLLAGWWQWQRAHRTEADAVPDVPAVALADLDPRTSFAGMRVLLTGRFDPDHEVLVAPRSRDDQPGAWVLTPLLPDEQGQAATAVGVVRGWVPQGSAPAAPPDGPVAVEAVLVADSRSAESTVPAGDPPTIPVVDTGVLSQVAGYPVRSGWFALLAMDPAGSQQPLPLEVTELPGAEVGLNWRNAAYAAQWVVFAAFAVFFWNRFRRELDRSTLGSSTHEH